MSSSSRKSSLLSLTFPELKKALKAQGEPAYRAGQIFKWLHEKGAASFADMTNLGKELREKLSERFYINEPKVEKLISTDGTIKFRFGLFDESSIESVWMPEEKRNTLCISSQVGCPLKCAFCVTGVFGLKRNLTVDEIVAQVRHVKVTEGLAVSNVVFMGMGEPLLNMDNVLKSIDVLSDPDGMAIGRRRITVSTAGIVPNIRPFVERSGVKLAISLTGASDESRDHWMPINKKYNLNAVAGELKKLDYPKGKKVTFEVVLIKDKTDSLEEAEKLSKVLKGLPAKVNLIPYNENPFFPDLKRPPNRNVDAFKEFLMKKNIHATVRKNRGTDILAACGQLAGKALENKS